MFEEMTFENLMKRALSYVSKDFDKRQGSVIYDALAPFCAELAQMYISLDIFLNETFADTAGRKYLVMRAAERGLSPKEAEYAVVLAEMTGNFELSEGARFNCDELNYFYTGEWEEKDGKRLYRLKCETAGTAGNLTYGTLIPIDNVKGLETAEIYGTAVSGSDAEGTEAFRKRYFDSFESQAFGGNRKDYEEKMLALNNNDDIRSNGGVGGVKLYRTPKGGGTVKVVFANNSFEKPTDRLINLVQTAADPAVNGGDGVGFVPIGHSVEVCGVGEKSVDFDLRVDLEDGYIIDDVMGNIENALGDYLKELRSGWADSENIVVYKFVAGSRALSVGGVKNVADIKLSNSSGDLILGADEIPVRGYVNVAA